MKWSLDTSKLTDAEDIPFKIIKDNADIFSNFILKNFNKSIIEGKFPDQLKKADVSPVFKNGNHNDKTNYRPVSILPLFSKIYERLIYNQVNHMTENALSVFLCGFWKKYSTQHTLIAMTEKARKIPDKGGTFIIQSISLWFLLFVEEADIMSYADGNTPYVCSENVDVTLEKLEEVEKYFLNGFQTIS